MRAMHPDLYQWGQQEYMLADLIDIGHHQYWAASGGKRGDKPKPYPRPSKKNTEDKHTKGTAVPMDQLHDRLRKVQGQA